VHFTVREVTNDEKYSMPGIWNDQAEYSYRLGRVLVDASPMTIRYQHFTSPCHLYIIRDDLLVGGVKSRFLQYVLQDPKFSRYREFIYASGWPGGAQVSLADTVKRLNKKDGGNRQATIFIESTSARSNTVPEKPFPQLAKNKLDAQYIVTPESEMPPAISKYVMAKGDRKWLTTGLQSDIEALIIQRMATDVLNHFKAMSIHFDEVWACVGEGIFMRALASVPKLAEKFVGVSVYPDSKVRIDGVTIIPASRPLTTPTDPVKEVPPVPSARYYDAKVWVELSKRLNKVNPDTKILWWNMY